MPGILVIDTGQDIVGIYVVAQGVFTPYRGVEIAKALEQIKNADEVVTYNGTRRDFPDLASFAGLPTDEEFRIRGKHTDMQIVIWSDRILGRSLYNTYLMHFPAAPKFADTYEGSNEADVSMTFKLWELWKHGTLKVLDGNEVQVSAT